MDPSDALGVWLVGARGAVATTAMTGWCALRDRLVQPTGLVTESTPLAHAPLAPLPALVFGGHDIDDRALVKQAHALAADRVLPADVVERAAEGLEAIEADLRPGIRATDAGGSARAEQDLRAFIERHGLRRVVVINVSSTEPPAPDEITGATPTELEAAADSTDPSVPASVRYAVAAMRAGCAFVDFTPSSVTRIDAFDALARARRLPYAGRDGKTGETLLKAALAPMFLDRALHVRSWAGTNVLGGGDGKTLSSPENVHSKLASKKGILQHILGEEVESLVRIDYVADLGQWKTAWDLISFDGFLGTPMKMQFTWEGCDAALAAPLVLDLARLTGAAMRAREVGTLGALGYFFKDPVGSDEHRLDRQFARLCHWALSLPGA